MKFLIIKTWGSYIIEADDISEAVEQSYNNHTKFEDVIGIICIEEKSY